MVMNSRGAALTFPLAVAGVADSATVIFAVTVRARGMSLYHNFQSLSSNRSVFVDIGMRLNSRLNCNLMNDSFPTLTIRGGDRTDVVVVVESVSSGAG